MSGVFYLGTHEVPFLAKTDVPLFLSRRRLAKRKTFPRALGPWALDSGGYTELSQFGEWSITVDQYAKEVELWREEIGNLRWVAPMDWMTEPNVMTQTGLTVEDHRRNTVENFLELRDRLGPLVIPVLQGWELTDYLRCLDAYADAGVELDQELVVGVGSVCRRNSRTEIGRILRRLASEGLRLHAFGVKATVFSDVWPIVESTDSMAWSSRARGRFMDGLPPLLDTCTHKTCANCIDFALWWRQDMLHQYASQLSLWKENPCLV